MSQSKTFRKMKIIGAIFLLLILCALVFQTNIQDHFRSSNGATIPALGPAEVRPQTYDFAFQNLNHETTSLSAFRGRVVYINFWAEWCEPCLEEMPIIETLAKEYGEKLQVILINVDQGEDSQNQARQKQMELAPTPLVVYERTKALEEMMNVQALPYHILVDKNGRTATAFYTTFINQEQRFRQILLQLVNE